MIIPAAAETGSTRKGKKENENARGHVKQKFIEPPGDPGRKVEIMKKAILRANGRNMNLSNLAVECSVADIDAAIELSKNGEDLCRRLHRAGAAIEFRPSMETIAWYSVVGEDWNGNRHVLRVTR